MNIDNVKVAMTIKEFGELTFDRFTDDCGLSLSGND